MSRQRKLFCQLGPTAYRLSSWKCRTIRHVQNLHDIGCWALERREERLPALICAHKSLIRRRLGEVDMRLQENKAVNLALAAPKVSGVLIRPGQIFSFWKLVGACTARKGYREGLTIGSGQARSGVGGGMCQFTNLIHWLALHSPLDIVEHHHHDDYDLFPDFGRQVPFGVGTSIVYNYLDYRLQNNTDQTFQLVTYTTGEYLCGELRAESPLPVKYHIRAENAYFSCENGIYYRNNEVFRTKIDKHTGCCLERQLIKKSHARVLYDPKYIAEEGNGPCSCERESTSR